MQFHKTYLGGLELIVWKRAKILDDNGKKVRSCLVKLSVPKDTKIYVGAETGSNHNKCRANRLRVIKFYTLKGKKLSNNTHVVSDHDRNFKYNVGSVVEPKQSFSSNNVTCASGIHFFFVKEAAKNWG
jgi:hypothetical protein